jgi:hypothetical protein
MIARFLRKHGARLRARWLRGSINEALELSRYEVRRDGLLLEGTTFRLAITWCARQIHPWDCDLEADKKAHKLVDQTFDDTLTALERLFVTLPEVDTIDFRVMEGDTRKRGVLLNGLVSRREFETCRLTSPTMRLRLLGVNYNLINSRLEPLTPSYSEHEIPISEIDARDSDGSYPSGLGKGSSPAWHQDKAGPQ